MDECYERIVAENARAFLEPDGDDDGDSDSWLEDEDHDADCPPEVWAADAMELIDCGFYPAMPEGAD